MGAPADKVADRTAMTDGAALEWFIDYAAKQRDYTL